MSILPDLPKKNKRNEAKFDGKVANWFMRNHPRSVLIEVKMKGGRLTDHQKKLIDRMANTRKLKYKFPDGARRTPLDYVVLKDADVALCVVDEKGNVECEINKTYKTKFKVQP